VDIFVARQPIFDLRNQLFGYELLYRSNAAINAATGATAEQMASKVIIHSFVDIGLQRITGDKAGFLNCSRETLLGGFVELLSPHALVVELLETVEPDAEVVAAATRLHRAGYTLALDDFEYDPRFDPLLRLVEIVKLDVLNRSADEIERLAEPLKPYAVRLLAERVETAEVYEVCRSVGFELFQGYHFSRPEILSRRDLPVVPSSILQLMNLLRDTEVSDLRVEAAFRSDPVLTYKLLRIVNSAAVGGRGIESILHAIRLLGRASLGRWLALLLVASLGQGGDPNQEVAITAIARAYFCEHLATASGHASQSGALFMVGLFSLMDVLLGTPMEEILGGVGLAPSVRQALLRREGPLAVPLSLTEAYQRADWDYAADAASLIGVPATDLTALYLESLSWAQEQFNASAER
jgi:c-di-GMP phosphodiesterase